MGLDIGTTLLGYGSVDDETVAYDPMFAAYREEQVELLRLIEARLREQLGPDVSLERTSIDGYTLSADDRNNFWSYSERVNGFPAMQYGTLQYLMHGELSTPWQNTLECMREAPLQPELHETAAPYRHLIDHALRTGIYLPIDFSEPIWLIDCALCSDVDLSIGSTPRLRDELERWQGELGLLPAMEEYYTGMVRRLITIIDISLSQGVAIEIV